MLPTSVNAAVRPMSSSTFVADSQHSTFSSSSYSSSSPNYSSSIADTLSQHHGDTDADNDDYRLSIAGNNAAVTLQSSTDSGPPSSVKDNNVLVCGRLPGRRRERSFHPLGAHKRDPSPQYQWLLSLYLVGAACPQ